ncbi:hypothetical protein AAG570_000682 [Ranatra chinensis]|uniref:Uncharacterized protein n=1 Tax=Ranatra chinensis TaxID=642074 RepID=A0ABD0ZAG1_9HEMI
MASKRRNMFHKNKTQETTEEEATYWCCSLTYCELYCDESLKAEDGKQAFMFYQNKKQETTEKKFGVEGFKSLLDRGNSAVRDAPGRIEDRKNDFGLEGLDPADIRLSG